MISIRYIIFSISVFLLCAFQIQAQEIRLKTTLDTTNVQIGDQFKMTMWAEHNKGELLGFPDLKQDSAYSKIEVLEFSEIDSTELENNKVAIKQQLKLTVWEKGKYVLPPLKFTIMRNGKTDTLTANEMLLQVGAPQIDTTQAIKQIAPIYATPFTFDEFMERYFIYVLIGLAVIALIIILILYMRNREETPKTILKRPKIPAHETAYTALNKLKEEKLWEQGKYKEYHSELTDILKHYLEQRYRVTVMELTSHETMIQVKSVSQSNSETNRILEKIFDLADLAKFAKYQPLSNENVESMEDAFAFVERTKERPAVQNEDQENNT